ncbi:MAG: DUF2442 domain-containing protein [Deltaproteobacteria bacterium]|nr:DUF2442 domain-containing protein [Deltaproteobacteria bacterium]
MYLSVKYVQPLDNYKLLLTFENDEQRIFDMSSYMEKGIFTELKDQNFFKSVHVGYDTIEWGNGADLDPELLYKESYP